MKLYTLFIIVISGIHINNFGMEQHQIVAYRLDPQEQKQVDQKINQSVIEGFIVTKKLYNIPTEWYQGIAHYIYEFVRYQKIINQYKQFVLLPLNNDFNRKISSSCVFKNAEVYKGTSSLIKYAVPLYEKNIFLDSYFKTICY